MRRIEERDLVPTRGLGGGIAFAANSGRIVFPRGGAARTVMHLAFDNPDLIGETINVRFDKAIPAEFVVYTWRGMKMLADFSIQTGFSVAFVPLNIPCAGMSIVGRNRSDTDDVAGTFHVLCRYGSLAEDKVETPETPETPEEPECRCRSLLIGHESGCRFAR